MEEGGKERTKEEVFAVVGCWWKYKKRKKKKKKRRDKRASHSTLCIIDYGKCITFSCKIFIPIKKFTT
jgi:hypothetical protein